MFFNRIKNKSDYKLINGLFIVRNMGNGIFKHVGDYHKRGSVLGNKGSSIVDTKSSGQLFNPSKRLTSTRFGIWKKLNIGFRMKPISQILK